MSSANSELAPAGCEPIPVFKIVERTKPVTTFTGTYAVNREVFGSDGWNDCEVVVVHIEDGFSKNPQLHMPRHVVERLVGGDYTMPMKKLIFRAEANYATFQALVEDLNKATFKGTDGDIAYSMSAETHHQDSKGTRIYWYSERPRRV